MFVPYFRTNLQLTYSILFDYLLQNPVNIDGIDPSGNDLAAEGQQPLNEQSSLSQVQSNENLFFFLVIPLQIQDNRVRSLS